MDIKLIYSYNYTRQLNYHRSREQIWERFQTLAGSCEELEELIRRFLLKSIYKLEEYAGHKIPREEIRIYVVARERGGSFHEPVTLDYDEDQKFMFAMLVHLVGHHLVDEEDAIGEAKINLITQAALKQLPLDFSRQIRRLHKTQQQRYPEYFELDTDKYDVTDKPLPELFAPPKQEEEPDEHPRTIIWELPSED